MTPDFGHEHVTATSLSLIERVKQRDQDAWQRFVQLYGPLIYGWCRKSGLQAEDAADVLQDVCRSLSAGGIDTFRRTSQRNGAFRGWLRTVTLNRIRDFCRARAGQPEAVGGSAVEHIAQVVDQNAELSDEEITSENTAIVRRALDLIRPDFSEQIWRAFWLVAIEGKATDETADQLKVTAAAVRQANYRVRRRLRDELAEFLR
jgi:RNA polymerase sigma-70 factor (ECF subfamily)